MNAVLELKPSPLLHAADESFWRDLNPDLNITPHPLSDRRFMNDIGSPLVEQSVARMVREGYFSTPPLIDAVQAGRLARVVQDLVQRGIPPAFAFIYDEFWQLFQRLHPVLAALLGDGYRMVPSDIWGWHIDKSSAGWGPHRDAPSREAVRDDRRPRVINAWIPLTDVTPLNACMYVLPTHLDPNIPDNMEAVDTFDIRTFQNIRAIPAPAGSALGWNTQVLHWGGKSSDWAEQPRISVAIYLHSEDCDLNEIDYSASRTGFSPLTFDHTFEMPFALRLRALAGAIRLYAGRIRTDFPDTHPAIFEFSKTHFGG